MAKRLEMWKNLLSKKTHREEGGGRGVGVPQFLEGENIPPAFYEKERIEEAQKIFAHYDLIS